MLISRFVMGMVVSLTGLGAEVASGQDFPNKPIRILTGSVGGSSDVAARLIAQGLTASLGQQVIVDNRGRPSPVVVSKSSPDGYNLLLDGVSFWMAPLVQAVPYDPIKDFAPITTVTNTVYILVVHPSLPVKSVKELIALAKAKPGVLNYSSGTAASLNRLAAELFLGMAGVNIVRVPYGGGGPAVNAVISGEVQLSFATAPGVVQHINPGGRLRALAISTAKRNPSYPDLPTIMESGLPDYEVVSLQGLFATAKTPASLVNRLSQEIVRVLNRTDVREGLLSAGMVATGSSPEQFAAIIKTENAKWGKVVKDVGIRVD